MMETTGFGWGAAELLLLLFSGQFLGLVPGERDAELIKSPPRICYFYQEWTAPGVGVAGAPGLEGFVADPEIRELVQAVQKSLLATAERPETSELDALFPSGSDVPALLMLAARHAGALYVAGADSDRSDTPLPGLEAALILSLEEDAEQFVARLNQLLQSALNVEPMAKPDRQIVTISGKSLLLHQDGQRLILTTSPAALDRLLQRWQQPEAELASLPAYSQALNQGNVAQAGGLCWLNAAALQSDVPQRFGLRGAIVHNVANSLGLASLHSAITLSGIDQHDQVSRTRIALAKDWGGLLKLFSSRALQPADFAIIPADVDFVAASSVNLELLRDIVLDVVAKTLPEAVRGVNEFQRQLEQELQLSLDDITAGFGDVWTLHDSPANGGLILTGLVGGIPVRDQECAQRVVARLKELLIESLPRYEDQGGASYEEHGFLGTTISTVSPSAPAFDDPSNRSMPFSFCLTETHLWIALHPQAIKAQLRFLATKEPRFDAAKKMALSISQGDVMTGIYIDTPTIGRTVYPLLPFLAQSSFGETRLIEAGQLPSSRAVLPYLRESTFLIGRDDQGVVLESKNSLPVLLALVLFSQLEQRLQTQGEFLMLGANNNPPAAGPAVDLGAAEGEGEVVQAKSEAPPKPAATEPSLWEKAARRTLPFVLRDAIPDQVESLIPPGVLERLAEPPTPEQAAERAQRREERRKIRAARRGARLAP